MHRRELEGVLERWSPLLHPDLVEVIKYVEGEVRRVRKCRRVPPGYSIFGHELQNRRSSKVLLSLRWAKSRRSTSRVGHMITHAESAASGSSTKPPVNRSNPSAKESPPSSLELTDVW